MFISYSSDFNRHLLFTKQFRPRSSARHENTSIVSDIRLFERSDFKWHLRCGYIHQINNAIHHPLAHGLSSDIHWILNLENHVDDDALIIMIIDRALRRAPLVFFHQDNYSTAFIVVGNLVSKSLSFL